MYIVFLYLEKNHIYKDSLQIQT